MNPTTHGTEGSASAPVLTMALELSNRSWRLAFGDGAKHRQVSVPAGACACAVSDSIALARKLPIALWRTLEDGVMPQGARLIASEI